MTFVSLSALVRTLAALGIAVAIAQSAALAQTSPQRAANPPAKAPAAPAAPAVPAAPAQAPAADANPPPVRMETVVYDSWTLTCRDPGEKAGKKACSAEMRVAEKDKQVVVLAWLIGRDAQGVLRSVLQTPTGVLIAKGVELKLANKTVVLPYINCDAQRCESSVEMDDELQREAEAAGTVTATITTSDGRGISFNFAIKGIDKVLSAMAATR